MKGTDYTFADTFKASIETLHRATVTRLFVVRRKIIIKIKLIQSVGPQRTKSYKTGWDVEWI